MPRRPVFSPRDLPVRITTDARPYAELDLEATRRELAQMNARGYEVARARRDVMLRARNAQQAFNLHRHRLRRHLQSLVERASERRLHGELIEIRDVLALGLPPSLDPRRLPLYDRRRGRPVEVFDSRSEWDMTYFRQTPPSRTGVATLIELAQHLERLGGRTAPVFRYRAGQRPLKDPPERLLRSVVAPRAELARLAAEIEAERAA